MNPIQLIYMYRQDLTLNNLLDAIKPNETNKLLFNFTFVFTEK